VTLTNDFNAARHMCLVWGVRPIISTDAKDPQEMVEIARNLTREKEIAESGDTIVITAGVPFGNAGSTNILRIAQVN